MEPRPKGRIAPGARISRQIGVPPLQAAEIRADRKKLNTVYFVTINLNVSKNNTDVFGDDADNSGVSDAFSDAIESLADDDGEPIFKLCKSARVPALYHGDEDNLYDYIEKYTIRSYAQEWAPGKTKGKASVGKQYLHAHILLDVDHRSRPMVDAKAIQNRIKAYFVEKTGHGGIFAGNKKPYVNVEYVNFGAVKNLHLYMGKGLKNDDGAWQSAVENYQIVVDDGNVIIDEGYRLVDY